MAFDPSTASVVEDDFDPTSAQLVEDAPVKKRTWIEAAQDGGRSFGSSVNNTLKTIADLGGTNNPVSQFLDENAKTWQGNYSPSYKAELEKQKEEKAALGADPSYASRAALAARQTIRNPIEGIGEVAGNIAPMVIGGLAGLGAKGMIGLSAAMGGGAVKGGIAETVQNALDSDLMNDPLYADMRSGGMSEKDAKSSLSEQRASYGDAYGKILLGAGIGAAVGKFGSVESAITNMGKGAAGQGLLKSIGKEVATEIPQEMTETYLGNIGAAAKGAKIAADQGVVEAGVKAGILSAVGGAGAGFGTAKPADILQSTDVDSAISTFEQSTAPTATSLMDSMRGIGQAWQDLGVQPSGEVSNIAARQAGQEWQGIAQDQTGSLEQQRLDMEREGAALGQARDARLAEVGRQWQDLGITQPQDDLQAQRMGMRSGSLLEQQAAPLISQDVQAAQQLLQDQNGSTPSVLPSDSGSVGQEIAVPTQGMGDGIETGRPSGLQPGGLQDNSLDQSGKPSGEVPASAVIPTFNAQPTTLGTQTNAVAGQGSLDQRLTPVSQRNVQGQQEQPATVDAPVAGDATQATQLPRTGSASVQTDGIDRLRENVESSEPFSDNHIASIKALKQAVTQDANDSLSAGDAPVYVSKSGTTSVITPSAQKPGMYQVTRYNKTGAIGDSQYNSLKQAIDDNQLEDMPRMPKAEAVKHMASLVEAESKYQESKQVDQRLPPVSQRTESTNAQAPKKVSRANIPNDQKPDATEEQVTSVNEAEYQKSIKESIQARLGLVKPKQEEDERKTPFKAFLRKHGINSKYTSDIAGENRLKANNMLPATFRNNGLGLDALIERAIESGFVQERDRGDQDKFISMIQREIAGEKQVSSDVVNDDAEAQYERVQRMEIEELADRIGLPYSNDISTDKLASMVYRVERIKKQGAKTGTLKADRVKANALEIVARVEKKRAEYERQEAVFAQLTIAEQDASLDILTDEDGNPVIVRQAEIQAESAWAESQQEWNEQNGQTYTPEYPAAQQDQTPTAGIAEESSGRATQVGTQEQRRGNEAQDAGQAGSEGLTATTPEQVKADEQRREQAERAAKAQKKAKDLADKREQDRKDIAARSVGAADSFELGQDPLQSLTGQGSVFDMPDEPEAQTPVDRFEIGKSLTKEQRKSVIATLVDVYKSKGAPRESKGQGRDGNERSGYAHSPELFEKSDITGAMVRYYVTLPDGRMAHPSELFPDYTQNDINNEIERRANAENRNREIAKSQYLADTFDTKRDAAVFWNNLSDKSVKTASGKPTVYDAMDRTHITDGKKFAMIPTDVLKNQDMMDAIKAEGWTVAEAKPAEQATETLDAANVTGQERVTAMIAVNRGDLTPEQLAAAYPAKIDDAKPDNSVKPEAKDGNSIPTPEFKYTPASKIDTPAQGVLANAKEQKDQAFARLKKLRQQVRDGRSELRLELIKAESAHKDALRYVSEAQDQIERDANKQGLTTIKPVQESRGTTQNPTTVAALQSAIRDLVGAFGGNKLGRIVAATAAEIKENWEPLIGKSVQESQGGRSADDNSMGDPKAINGIPVLNGSMPDYFSDPQKFLDDIISSFGDSGNAIGLRGIYEDELGVLEIPNSHDNRADADNSELEGVSTYGVISDLSYDPDSVLKLFKEYGNSALDFGDTPYIAVIEGRPSIDDIANDPGEMVMRDAKTIAYIRRKTNESTTPSSGGAKYSKAALQTDTPEFKKWFGDWENNPESASKVVDENGEPLVVYHGTAKDFDAFDNRKTGANDRGLWGRGHYLASSPVSANSYALRQGDGARVIPAYVSIQNPLVLRTGSDLVTRLPDGTNTRELIGQNLDGSKIKSIAINGGHDGVIQIKPNGSIGDVVAFQPEQIKSAIGNNGQFDGTNPDIRYSLNLESEGDAGKAQAFFDPKTKTIFLIADNIEAGTEGAVLAHELMHKYGKEVLGEAGWSRLHSVIGTWATAKEGTQEREVYDQASEAVSRVGVELSTEELFPYAVEFAMKMGIKPDMAAGRGTVARWLESVRQNLKTVWDKITGKPETFKAQDLVNLAFGIAQMENNPEVTIREQTETPAFKKWFGNSKVVDANGKPLVVYHGTSKQVEFNEFKPSAAGVIYFTRKKEYANQMSKRRMVIDPMTADDYVGQVIPVYLNIKTPAFLSSAQMEDVGYSPSFVAQLKAAGHDGAVSKDGQIIVFDPTQIKSAIGNNGNFDPTNPDIRFARGDGMDAFRASLSKLSDPLPATDPKVIAKVQAWTDELSAKWENGPSIRVVSSFNDLPVPSTSDTRGLYYRGTVYVVASRVGSKRAVGEVLAHESVAHYGLREMLGKDDWQRFMGNIQLAIKSGNKPLNAIRDQIRSVYVDENGKPNLTPDQEADEIAARVVEKAIDANGEFKPGFAFVKSVYAKIAQFLRDMGLNVKMTHLELQGALINAQRYLEIGNRSSGGGYPLMIAARGDAKAARNDQTQTPEFKRWFGDSVVTDNGKPMSDGGKPLVVYHGTVADVTEFSEQNIKRPYNGYGYHFATKPSVANHYADHKYLSNGNVMPVYLNIKNPFTGDFFEFKKENNFGLFEDYEATEALKQLGYDGIRYDDTKGMPKGKGGVNYVAFDPTQVKSATGNNGNFDPSNPDIRYARGEPTAPDSFGAAMASRARIVGQTTRQHTPEQIRAMENVGFKVEVPTLKERIQSLTQDMGKKMAQGIVDQFRPIKDLSEEAYRLMRLSKGASGAFEVFLKGGKLKLTDGVYDFDDTSKGGVVDKLLIPLQGEHHDALRWVAANRAEKLQGEGRENLFTQADIDAFKTLADGDTDFDYTIQTGPAKGKVTRNRLEVYKDFNRVLGEFNKNVLDMAEQSGLIDPESRKVWESEFYVPFYRVADEDAGGLRGANVKAGVLRQQAFKQLKGGKNKLNHDLLDNTLMNWAHLLDASAKNRAAKASIEAAEAMGVATGGNQETLKQMGSSVNNKNGVVWFMDGGQKRYSLIDNQGDGPMVMVALAALENAGMKNLVMNAMASMKHVLTIGVTASPFFKVRNLIRDSVQTIGLSGINPNPAANLAQGWKLTDPKSDAYFRLLAGGGTIHFASMYEGSEAKRVQALVESGVDNFTILDDENKVKAFYRKFIEPGVAAYNELGNRGEAINRAALYDQLRKQGIGHAEASMQARDLMDFSMQGSFASIRFLTQVVPFMNARLQGLYKLGRSAHENPRRFGIVLASVTAVSLSLLAAHGDDEDWKKREEWDRNNFWWFKFGGTAFRIPKPFEIGAMATLAERGFELAFDKEMTNKRFMKQVMTLLGDNLSMNPVPQLVKPMLDVYANKNGLTDQPIESMSMEKLKSEYRFNANTSMAARAASTAMNSVTGLVNKEGLSPVQIDHMLRGYFGWLGSFVVGGADIIARPFTGQVDKPTADYYKLATGGMVADLRDAPSRYVSQMYEQAKEIEQAYGTWKILQKEGKFAESQEFMLENKNALAKYKSIEHVKKSVSKLNENIRIIERSNIDPDVKREKIRELQKQKTRIAMTVSIPRADKVD